MEDTNETSHYTHRAPTFFQMRHLHLLGMCVNGHLRDHSAPVFGGRVWAAQPVQRPNVCACSRGKFGEVRTQNIQNTQNTQNTIHKSHILD